LRAIAREALKRKSGAGGRGEVFLRGFDDDLRFALAAG
jgi:hypothetical protein